MTYSDLKNKLDRLFSSYIRLRDKEKVCISCGQYTDDKEAGHYYPRANLAVRWDEMNVHGQCLNCNRFRDGNHSAFGRGIAIRYGDSVLDSLDTKSQQRIKLKSYELLEKIELYQNKLKNFSR